MYQENYNQQEQMEDTDLTTGMSKMAKQTSTKDMLYVLALRSMEGLKPKCTP